MRSILCIVTIAALTACSSKPKPEPEKPKDDKGKVVKPVDDSKLKPCKVDEDCADDEDCIDGRCRQPWKDGSAGGGGDASCALDSIYFGYDQFTVSPDAGEQLAKGSECLKAEGERGTYVVGHTDPRGTEEYNIALSERRARAVADYLSKLGIDPARMHVVPKGESESQGGDESSFEKDRRVDFEWR